MKAFSAIAALFCLALETPYLMACEHGHFFLPQNDHRIPVSKNAGGIDEATFNGVIERFQTLFQPIFKARGRTLKINANWKSPMVNARAHRRSRTRYVTMYGGFARHEKMTATGFAVVLCHELGHHLGGAPITGVWASTEGQSDYFATAKCMRRYFDEYGLLDDLNVSSESFIGKICLESFDELDKQVWCQSNLEGSIVLSRVLAELQGRDEPRFETPDTTVVRNTNYRYPPAQCRLDTFVAGAICNIDYDISFSTKDPITGSCHPDSGSTGGERPKCWYSYR